MPSDPQTQDTGKSDVQKASDAGNFLKDVGDFFSKAFGPKPLAYGLQPSEAANWKKYSFVFKQLFHAGAFSGVKSDYKDFSASAPLKIIRYGKNENFVGDQPVTGDWFYALFGYRWSRLEPGLEGFWTNNNGGLAKDKEFWFDPIDFWPINRGSLTSKGFRETNPNKDTIDHIFNRVKTHWRHSENNNSQAYVDHSLALDNNQLTPTDANLVQPSMPPRGSVEQKSNFAAIGLIGGSVLAAVLLTKGEK